MIDKEIGHKERERVYLSRRFDGWCCSDLFDYYKCCSHQTEIDGLWMEFGVWMGCTLNVLSSLTDKTVYGFDSFEGLPEDWHKSEKGKLEKGRYHTKGKLPNLKNKNIQLVKGWFEDTLPNFVKEHLENCAVLHIDSDLYSSCKTILDNLRSRIVSGTVILFDELIGHNEYSYPLFWQGEMKAWLEESFSYEYLGWTHGPQVAVKIK